MHDITGSTVSIKAAAPANTSFRQCSYRPSTLLAAWWALLQFCRYAGFLLPYLHQAVQGGAADERWRLSEPCCETGLFVTDFSFD